MSKKKAASASTPKPKKQKQNAWGIPAIASRVNLIIMMALIKFGNGVSGISGKIDGTVFSRNTYGAIARGWAKPVDPKTTKQMQVRAAFGEQSQNWRTLTTNQQNGWISLASTVSFVNRLGESIFLSGQALFNKLNQNLISAGATPILDAPAYTVPDAPSSFVVTSDISLATMSAAFTPDPTPADLFLQVYATPPLSPGRKFVSNMFKLIANIEDGEASPKNVASEYEAVYGTSWKTAGLKIFFRVRFVNVNTGVASPLTQSLSIVIA